MKLAISVVMWDGIVIFEKKKKKKNEFDINKSILKFIDFFQCL